MVRALVAAFVVTALTPVALAVTPVKLARLHGPDAEHPLHPSGEAARRGVFEVEKGRGDHPRDRPANIDVLHYDLDLTADPVTGVLQGISTVTFRGLVNGLSYVVLDALDMQIVEVRDLAGRPLEHTYDGELVTIELAESLPGNSLAGVSVRYRALAAQELNLTHPDVTDSERMVAAYTYTQPEGSRTWYPCLDRPSDKATLTIAVTVPPGHRALSNGVPVGVSRTQEGGSRFADRLEQPTATYLVSLALGAYETHTIGSFRNKPLTLWTPPRVAAQALAETRRTQRMMEVFSEFTGLDYPFPVYGQAIAEAYRGSMEHQSATTMGGSRVSGDGSGEGVVAHELAHQWFGDWVTCRTWGNLWLNEGFATYLPMVFFAAEGEASRAWNEINWWRDGYFADSATSVRALSAPDFDIDTIFDSHSYEKGGLVIHYLRWLADRMPVASGTGALPTDSDGTFSEVLRHYLTQNGGGTVTSETLQASFEHVTGQSWQAVFDQWVRSPGHPKLSVSYEAAAAGVTLRVEQKQATRAENPWRTFSFVLPVELFLADGTRRELALDLYRNVQTFTLELPAAVVAVSVDPSWAVPAEVETTQSADAWRRILMESPHVPSRVHAVRALRALGAGELAGATLAAIAADPAPLVPAAAIEALTGDVANRALVQELMAALGARPSALDLPTRAAMFDAERWLVESSVELPSSEQQDVWRLRFVESRTVYERKALLAMLAKADLAASQSFALEQMRARDYTTFDELGFIDHLTIRPSEVVDAWLPQALAKDGLSRAYLIKALTNLKDAGYDRPAIVPALVALAREHRDRWTRESAIGLLGKQASSKELVCPALAEFLEAGRETIRAEAYAGIRTAALGERRRLACP
jgi:aminopeptidase N